MRLKHNEVTHAKGFSLLGSAKKEINFTALKSCVENKEQVIHVEYERKIVGNNRQQVLVEKGKKSLDLHSIEIVIIPVCL